MAATTTDLCFTCKSQKNQKDLDTNKTLDSIWQGTIFNPQGEGLGGNSLSIRVVDRKKSAHMFWGFFL